MGGVFAGAAQAPLTAIASVAEMTGNFTLTLPIMLACGLASQLADRSHTEASTPSSSYAAGSTSSAPKPSALYGP